MTIEFRRKLWRCPHQHIAAGVYRANATGSDHVLPTGAWSRRRSGLSSADFVKCISVQTISNKGYFHLAEAAETLAESGGLMVHRHAARIRR